VFPEYEKINEAINIDYLKELAESYYNKSLLDKTEQQEIEL